MLKIGLFWYLNCILMLNWIVWNKTLFIFNCVLSSRLGLQYTLTASLQKDKLLSTSEFPGYDTKQSDGEVPVMLELWEMQSIPSLLSLPCPLLPRVVAPDRVLFMGQIELDSVHMLIWIAWNRTVLAFNSL